MAAFPLPVAILDDVISASRAQEIEQRTGSGNDLIKNGDRNRKCRHLPPPQQQESSPHVLDDVISDATILDGIIQDGGSKNNI